MDQGLSHSRITDILKDKYNFMWFAASHGLTRYNGYDFDIFEYSIQDSTSIPNNEIKKLYEDSQGVIWIATISGLSRYSREQNNFINYYPDSSEKSIFGLYVQAICEDGSNRLWVATTTGLNVYDRDTDSFTSFDYKSQGLKPIGSMNPKGDMKVDEQNNIWIANMQYGLLRFNIANKTFKQFILPDDKNKTSPVTAIQIEGNIIWIGTTGSGLYKFNTQQEEGSNIIQYKHNAMDPQSISTDNILSLLYESKNKIWIGTINNGLDLFDSETGVFSHHQHDGNNPLSLNNNTIYSVYLDASDNLWVGTYAGGVNVSFTNLPKIELYRGGFGIDNSLRNNNVTSFIEDEKGNIWVGTDGGGLHYFDRVENRFTNYSTINTNLKSDAIHQVKYDSNRNLWLSAWEGGISKFNIRRKSFHSITTTNGLPDDNISSFIIDKKDRIWAGCFYSGLVLLDNKGKVQRIYNQSNSKLTNITIHFLYESLKGEILIGTNGGLFILNPLDNSIRAYYKNQNLKNSLTSNRVFAITEQDTGMFWLGTNYGLVRFDSNINQFQYFLKDDGLPSNMIAGLIFDKSGKLWISTKKGLARMDINTKKIKTYTVSDGLQGSLFNNNSVYLTRKNELFFGGTNGFNILYPDSLKENNEIPPVVFTDFQIFNKSVEIGKNKPLTKHISIAKSIELNYKHSVFSLTFAALSYEAPEQNQYAYMMEGFDDDWIYAGNKRRVTYTNLSPGEYIFRVKASNNDGIWDEKGKSIRIIIHPPFWQTNWFKVMIILLIIVSTVSYHIRRVNNEKTRNRILEESVEDRTKELKALNDELESFTFSVSHDLRAPLRTITGFTEIINKDHYNKLSDDIKQYFNKISVASVRMGQLIEDLLKLTRVGRLDMEMSKISLSTLVHEIYHNHRLTEPDRSVNFIIQPNLYIFADKRLVRILLNNLIQNAWKYTKNKKIAQIEFGKSTNHTIPTFFIKDNGVGFDMKFAHKLFHPFVRLHNENEFEGTGVGLATVKRIIDRHHGQIWIESNINKGTMIFFNFGIS